MKQRIISSYIPASGTVITTFSHARSFSSPQRRTPVRSNKVIHGLEQFSVMRI